MRRLLFVICLFAALYSTWWVVARTGFVRGLDAAEGTAIARGVAVTYDSRSTTGFPSRLDTTWRDVSVTTPRLRYQAPLVQLLALSYRPDRAILFAPGPHRISDGVFELELQSADSRASVRVVPGLSLLLDEARAQSDNLTVSLNGLRLAQARRVLTALRRAPPPDRRIDLYGLIADLTPTGDTGALPATIAQIELNAHAELSEPLAFRGAPPRPRRIEIGHATLSWGASRLRLSGALDVDGQGRLNGELRLTGQQWAEVLEAVVALGLIEPGIAQTWRNLGQQISDGDNLSLTLPVRDGRVMLGLVPIIVLPRLTEG